MKTFRIIVQQQLTYLVEADSIEDAAEMVMAAELGPGEAEAFALPSELLWVAEEQGLARVH